MNLSPEQRALLTDEERHSLDLCEKATEGPWHTHNGNYVEKGNWLFVKCFDAEYPQNSHNAAHIVNARTALPAALAEIARLREELAAAVAVIEPARRYLNTPPYDERTTREESCAAGDAYIALQEALDTYDACAKRKGETAREAVGSGR